MATLQIILLILAKVASTVFLTIILWIIFKRVQPLTLPNVLFLLLSCCYPIAKVCQAWFIGPRVVRWYFANIGAIPLTALLLLAITNKRYNIKTIRTGSTIGFVLAVLYELIQFVFDAQFKALPVLAHRRGDWIDLVIYPVIYLMIIWLTNNKNNAKNP